MKLTSGIFYLLLAVVTGISCLPAGAQSTLYGSAYPGPLGLSTLYRLSMVNGAATTVGPIGSNNVGALDFSSNGTLYGVGYDNSVSSTDSFLITINTTTGAGTLIGNTGIDDKTQDIAFRPSDGTLFAYSVGNIWTINTSTGLATELGATGGGFPDGNGLAFSGSTLYLANTGGGGQGTLWTIDQSSGAETPLVSLTFDPAFGSNSPRVNGMKFDPATGTLWASVVTGGGRTAVNYVGTINITTGFVSFVGSTVSGLDAVALLAPVSSNSYFTTYYSNANTTGAPDATVRMINDGASGTNLYADIYVFDDSEELTECCSCLITPDGLLSESVNKNLTANPLTGIKPQRGVIKVVASGTNDPIAPAPTAGLHGWATHIQKAAAGFSETEAGLAVSNLSASELMLLGNLCKFDGMLSGKQCSCTPEDQDF